MIECETLQAHLQSSREHKLVNMKDFSLGEMCLFSVMTLIMLTAGTADPDPSGSLIH